jgi:hypothetical protein
MNRAALLRCAVGAGGFAAALAGAAETYVVPPEVWDRPRSARVVLEQPAIRQAVNAWLARPGARLVVRHAPSQDSALAAEELRSWLAALAVEPGRIALRNDLKPAEPLRLEVIRD